MEANRATKPYVIDTASGARLDLDNPRPEDIRIEDVAGGLSKVCRFGAQAREYYSVAQHALLVQRLVVEAGHSELALAALRRVTRQERVGGRAPRCSACLGPLRHEGGSRAAG
jgi:hypothetical protein